jgi:vitamin B12 transporter
MSMVKSLSTSILMTVLITGSWSGLALAAAAADTTEPTYTLDEVVVTATRTENKKVDTPANVTVVDAKKIESRGYTDAVEALKDVPGAQISSTGTHGYERVIRLNGDERVVVMVDGKRVNTSTGTMTGRANFDANTLPPVDAIERVEVVKGSGGALYGSDAVGGVINIITKKTDHNYGTAKVGFGSWGAQDYAVTYGGKKEKTGFMISADRQRQSDVKYKNFTNGNTESWSSANDYDQKKLSLKLDQGLTKDTALGLTYDYSKMDGHTPGNALNAIFNPVDKTTNNLGLKYDWGVTKENKGFVQLYRNYYGYYNQGDIGEVTVGLDAQQQVVTSDRNKLVFGASYYDAKADNAIAYSGSKSINNKAIFVQDEWQFVPTWKLNTGVRYDHHSTAGGKTTGSVAVNKKFNENSNAYLSWGQIFKAPNIDDLYYYYYNKDYDSGMYGNENLKPETGDQWTLGYNVQTSPSTTLGISAFYANLKDAIDWVSPDYSNYYATNINKQKRRGLELTASHKLNDNFDLEASYDYIKVENDKADGSGYVADTNVVPNLFKVGVRYHNAKWNVDLYGRGGSGADTVSKVSWGTTTASYLDSHYFTLDLAAKYKINKKLGAYLNLYNITNAAYVEQAGASNGYYKYPMAGRRFMAGVTYTF